MLNYLIRWPSWILTFKWNSIISLMCSQILRKHPVAKLFQALRVLDADSWKCELAPVRGPLGRHSTMARSKHWSKSHAGTWTACFSSVNCATIRFFKECMVRTTILPENLARKYFGKYLHKFLISPICNWFLFWTQGYYQGQICFSKEAL